MQAESASPELVDVGPIPGIEKLWDPEFDIVLQNVTIDAEEVEEILERLVKHWTTPPIEGQSLRDWSIEKMGIKTEMKTHEALVEVAKDRMRDIANMLFLLKKNELYAEGDFNRDKLARSFCACQLAFETLEKEVLLRHVFDADTFANVPLPKHISKFSLSFLPQPDNYTSTQCLMIYALQRMQKAGYRRLSSECYREIKVDGMGTHAWEPVMTIEEFVYFIVNKDQNGAMWEAATKTGSAIPDTVRYLTHCYEDEFRELEPNRYVFSFRNGQYDITEGIENAFHPIEGGGNALDTNIVAINYWDVDFDHNSLLVDDWRDIQVPLFDNIFKYQGYDDHTMEMVYAMLGRLLFPVSNRDAWQVVPFFLGVAGCGKSTAASIVKAWYPPKFVSIISGNMEDKFGLAGIVDTLMCQCLEVTAKFPLNRGVWQSMVTGEPINVPRKHKAPVQGPWTVPMIMAGNEVPNWEDKSGSVHRRVAVFSMKKAVNKNVANPKLEEILKADPAPLLVKCSRAYLELSQKYGEGSFWKDEVASAQMQEWHKDLLQDIDTLSAYLASSRIVKDEFGYILEDELRQDYKSYLTEMGSNFSARDWNRDHLTTVYDRNGLTCENATKMWPLHAPTMHTGRFITGIRLASSVIGVSADSGGIDDMSIDGTM